MKLVEVIPGLETGEKTVTFMMDCCRRIDKVPVRIKDVLGFAVNRILHAMMVEANPLVVEGVASPKDIDTACKLGLGYPIGPYALMDVVGIDLTLRVQEILFGAYVYAIHAPACFETKGLCKSFGQENGPWLVRIWTKINHVER
jgi:3-hydroxybutyryl-CoA dehydrogenase